MKIFLAKFSRVQISSSNSTVPEQEQKPEIIYQINYNCNDGEYFDANLGKCVVLNLNNTITMFNSFPTKTKTNLQISQNVTIAECLNKTENKYDNNTIHLTINPAIEVPTNVTIVKS